MGGDFSDKPWLTIAQVCEELGVTRPTAQRWLDSGALRYYRFSPKTLRIRRDDLEAFIEASQAEFRSKCSTPPPGDDSPGSEAAG